MFLDLRTRFHFDHYKVQQTVNYFSESCENPQRNVKENFACSYTYLFPTVPNFNCG